MSSKEVNESKMDEQVAGVVDAANKFSATEAETEEKKSGKGLKELLLQVIKFGMVGVINTLVSYLTYSLFYYVFHTNEFIATAAGFVVSVFEAFCLQSKFVFKESEDGEKRVWWKVLLKTYVSYSFTGLFLAEVLVFVWMKLVHLDLYIGGIAEMLRSIHIFGRQIFSAANNYDLAVSMVPFLNMAITIPINFCINKFWAYRQKKKAPEDAEQQA